MLIPWETLKPNVGDRLDSFLANHLQRSRNHAQDLIKQGAVKLSPERARLAPSYRLRVGDSVIVDLEAGSPEPVEEESAPQAEEMNLNVIFEDEWLLVLNKPAGLVVHPAAGHAQGTLVNGLLHHCGEHLAKRGGEHRLGIVHRLDKDTSGLLIVAKQDIAHERLAKAFAERTVSKMYRALVWGMLRRPNGQCLGAIGRNPNERKKMAVLKEGGRESRTDYRTLVQGKHGAEVECQLHTGRTHQIRVHMAHITHPIWGDNLYGKPHPVAGFSPARQMLHAFCLKFTHPMSKKVLTLEAKVPADYEEAKKMLLAV